MRGRVAVLWGGLQEAWEEEYRDLQQNAEAGEDQASGAPGLICLQDTHLTILKCPTLFSFPRQRGWKLLP